MRTVDLKRRLKSLEVRLRAGPDLDEIAPEWQDVSATSPEAYRRAAELTAWIRTRWDGREPLLDAVFADAAALQNLIWLEATRAGGLGQMLVAGTCT